MYKQINELYNALYDERSKRNFINRMAFNLSGDWNYLVNLIDENIKEKTPNLAEYLRGSLENKRLIIYGAGNTGKVTYDYFQCLNKTDDILFCDRDIVKQEQGFCGKKVISPEELVSKYRDCYVLIETYIYYEEAYDYLISHQFPEENIIKHYDFGWHYFDYEYMSFSNDEIMIDAGCLNCYTLKQFIQLVGGTYNKIIAFEPDAASYQKCMNIVNEEKIKNVELINAGLWKENTTLAFRGGNKVPVEL